MTRLQTALQLLRGTLLDIIVVASRHRAAVDERRALVWSIEIPVTLQLRRFEMNKLCRK
jgi:hypothetical protein